MNSILQTEKYCYFCKTRANLHLHHIYHGSNRKNSDTNGFCVYLCARHHNFSNKSVHFDKEMDLKLKKECQIKFEQTHSRAEFIKIIGKNYL